MQRLRPLIQLFRLWLGVTEYLFRKPDLLSEVINTAIEDNTFRSDDLEFTFAARVSPPNPLLSPSKNPLTTSPPGQPIHLTLTGLVRSRLLRRLRLLPRPLRVHAAVFRASVPGGDTCGERDDSGDFGEDVGG